MKKIIVAPKSIHKNLLKTFREEGSFVDIKLISKEELFTNTFGSFRTISIKEIMKKEGIKYVNAKKILSFIPLAFEDHEDNQKLHFLNELYNWMDDNGWFTYNEFYKYLFINKDIEVIGYSKYDNELQYCFKILGINPTFIEPKKVEHEFHYIQYPTLEDEAFNILNSIASLIDSNVSPKNIYIYTSDEEIIYLLDKFSSSFGFKINIPNHKTLFTLESSSKFFAVFKETKTLEFALDCFECLDDQLKADIYDLIRESTFEDLSFEQQLDYYVNVFKNTKIRNNRYENAIDIINEPIYRENAHIFIPLFIQGVFPSGFNDCDYLSDKDKKIIGLNTSLDLAKIDEDLLLTFLHSNNSFYISYPKQSFKGGKFFASPLIKSLYMIKDSYSFPEKFYSQDMIDFSYAKSLDMFRLYKEVSTPYVSLNEVSNISYLTYDNKYTPVDVYQSNSDITYSYSAIKKYYECPFSYYLSNVLKLDPFDGNFNTISGNIAHGVFEHIDDDDFDFEEKFNEYLLKDKDKLNLEELILIQKFKEQIKDACDAMLLRRNYMAEHKILHEYPCKNIPLNEHAIINGKIDEVEILNDQYLVLIDYKTSAEEFNPQVLEYGFSMQLPTYALLAHQKEELKDYPIIGLFINNIKYKSMKTPTIGQDGLIYDYLKLNGTVVDDRDYVKLVDSTIDSNVSKFLKGVKINNDGSFHNSSALVSKDDFINYETTALKLYKEADEKIRNNEFNIAPKAIRNVVQRSCEYCPFKDICFVKECDLVDIELKKDEEEAME